MIVDGENKQRDQQALYVRILLMRVFSILSSHSAVSTEGGGGKQSPDRVQSIV